MRIKRFRARDIPTALRMVKEELGPDAVILSTREIKDRAELGPMVEVTAGAGAPRKPAGLPLEEAEPIRLAAPSRTDLMDGSGSSLKGLEGGLAEIKELLLDLTHRTSLSQRLRDRPEMVRLYRDLVNAELDPSLARALVERVAAEPNGRSDPYRILESSLARLIRVGSPLAPRSEDLLTGPRFVAVVGPSGVGKTTTTAKLAAHWASGLGRRVGLISLDTFRLGASEQIRAYARIMGLPCRVAQDREQLTGALELFETMDLVLIDTSGRASARPEDARELEDLLGAIPDLSVLLVLSATTKDRDLSQVIRRHESYSFLSLVISKIDETLAYGNVMNNLIKFKKPVSFLTNGQKVPDDLVPATAGRLAELVVASIRSADKA